MRTTITNPSSGRWAATRRFPSEGQLIVKMMNRSESFRGLCDDLAEAERALAATDQMPEAFRRDRRAECQEWVESLTNEIKQALRRAKVIHFAEAKQKQTIT